MEKKSMHQMILIVSIIAIMAIVCMVIFVVMLLVPKQNAAPQAYLSVVYVTPLNPEDNPVVDKNDWRCNCLGCSDGQSHPITGSNFDLGVGICQNWCQKEQGCPQYEILMIYD